MNERDEQRIQELVRNVLERDADGLDADVTVRLAAARRRALGAVKPEMHWQPVAGWAMAASALLAVSLWWQTSTVDGVNAEDFEILVSGEQIELYEDLEFYDWLGSDNDAG
jgi:hypothetical protein